MNTPGMNTATIDTPAPVSAAPVARRTPPPATPFRRILRVEARKMFDTRSGFWMLASIGILSVIATGATIIFGDRQTLGFEDFASAVGIPMSVILPMIGVLSITSEWSQRTGLTTFTLVSGRGRTVAAKLVNVLVIGAVAMVAAMAIGALGNIIVSNAVGSTTQWGVSVADVVQIILASELGMLVGFVLGLLIRNSPGAIVGYFVYALVLPGISGALAAAQDWWADHAAWFDLGSATYPLYDAALTSREWAQLGVSSLLWLIIPGLIGLRLMLRSEVK